MPRGPRRSLAGSAEDAAKASATGTKYPSEGPRSRGFRIGQVGSALIDDLDGGEADETVAFAVDGRSYEVDLSAKSAAKLREAP